MATNRAPLAAIGVAVLLTTASGLASAHSQQVSAGSQEPTGSPQTSCIAVIVPSVQGLSGNADDAATGVRDLIVKYLSGPSTKVVPLESRLPPQAIEEARQKGCEPILVSSLTRKTGGGRLTRALGQAAGTSSYYLPGGSTVVSAAARTATAAGLQTASSLATSTKARDEMRLEYRLQSASGQVQFGPKTESRTASVDGEDLLTPIVAQAAETVITGYSAMK